MFHVDTPQGCLVVARWSGMREVQEAMSFRSAVQAAAARVKPAVICADWRVASVVSPEVSEVVAGMLRATNLLIKRSGILLSSESATFSLQTERLVREANNPQRRTFRQANDLLLWIGEVLSPVELDTARRFLESKDPPAA